MTRDELSRVPRRPSELQSREFGTETVLLNPRTGQYCQINDSAALIWAQIDGRRTIHEIVNALAAHVDCAPEAITGDVEAFLTDLALREFLTL